MSSEEKKVFRVGGIRVVPAEPVNPVAANPAESSSSNPQPTNQGDNGPESSSNTANTDKKDSEKSSSDPQPSTSKSSGKKRKQNVGKYAYEKRRLTKAQMRRKKEILAKFHCPFEDKCIKKNECYFHHGKVSEGSSIKHVPTYACPHFLTGGCCCIPFARKNFKKKKCTRGVHLTFDDLDNIPQFEEKHAELLKDHMCVVCLEYLSFQPKTERAYMVNCTHDFCVPCIKRVFESKSECPHCRTEGPYIASKKPLTSKQKAAAKKVYQRNQARDLDADVIRMAGQNLFADILIDYEADDGDGFFAFDSDDDSDQNVFHADFDFYDDEHDDFGDDDDDEYEW